jgi:hypothetical protein
MRTSRAFALVLWVVAVGLNGCDAPHRQPVRWPEHRKLEEHRIEVLEANAPRIAQQIRALEKRAEDLEARVRQLQQAGAPTPATSPPAVDGLR